MSPWKRRLVALTAILLGVSLPAFLVSGCTALYWAWLRGDPGAALPYLPWARGFAMLALTGAAAAFALLFSSNTFPIPPKSRLLLSLLATAAIAFFSEFRNEGKFYFKGLVHFFGRGTWAHEALHRVVPSLGDFLYRLEYSHWNDFLMGPAVVSALFFFVFFKVYGSFRDSGSISLGASASGVSADVDHALRFARILMNVGLFWFFIQAWAEKAGYLSNPHSKDEIDLPFEFAGTMLGFWMGRVLTKPFDRRSEKFRSTLFIDLLSSGVVGLLYTLIVGPLTESVAGTVAHALYPLVPGSLDVHEYTPLQQHMRPLELLVLAGAMWWALNRLPRSDEVTSLSSDGEPQPGSKWDVLWTLAKPLGATTAYLLVVVAMLSFIEPEGTGSTLATAALGMAIGTAALLLVRRYSPRGLTTVFGRNEDAPGG